MKRFLSLSLALFLAGVLVLSGCSSKNTSSLPTQNISTAVVKTSNSGNPIISGKIEAVAVANVVSKNTGKVAQVNVDIGSQAEKGQILVALESDELAANIESAQAALDTAQINLDQAGQNLDRAKILLSSGAMSQSDFQNNYQSQYQKAEASFRSSEAALKKAQITYSDSFIRAPFDGMVTACNVHPGEMASISTTVVSLVNLDQVVIKGLVDENQINNLKLDQQVQVSVSAAMPELLTGYVCNISPAAESSTKAYPVKVRVDNPNHLLKPGMFGEVRLPENNIETITIPQEAVLKDGEKPFVFVVKDGLVEKRSVTVGTGSNGQLPILSGLSKGETLVTQGAQLLQEGQKI
ncbi:MAG: efflux RND transporter periplasmic adaptor subunit [Syntrophomonas sp.]